MINIHLIIQGPIYSISPPDDIFFGNTKYRFDCRDNIKALIKKYSSLFSSITLATWKNSEKLDGLDFQEINREIPIKTIFLNDIGRGEYIFGEIPDDRLRQYYSVLKGLEYINSKYGNKNISLKIRTDQFLDLEDIINQTISKDLINSNKLLFPFALEGQLFSVNDYFIAGNTKPMINYFTHLVDNVDIPVASKSIHVDWVQKYLSLHIKDVNKKSYKPKFTIAGTRTMRGSLIPLPKSHIVEWIKLLEKYFFLSDPTWITNTTVRGKSLDFLSKKIFNEDLKNYQSIFNKLTIYNKRKLVKDNLITNFIFGEFNNPYKNSNFGKYLYKFNYFLRMFLLSF